MDSSMVTILTAFVAVWLVLRAVQLVMGALFGRGF